MQSEFERKIQDLVVADPRYDAEAYRFVSAAVNFTVGRLKEHRHVSARELLDGAVEFACREFGALAGEVLREWGIRTASDLGEIVYLLIGVGLLSASPEDRREDFDAPFPWFPAPVADPGGAAALPYID